MKITKKIQIPLNKISGDLMFEIQEELGDLVINEILRYTSQARSPVYGDSFDSLDEKYKSLKVSKGGKGIANLRMDGDLMASLEWRPTPNGIEVLSLIHI